MMDVYLEHMPVIVVQFICIATILAVNPFNCFIVRALAN